MVAMSCRRPWPWWRGLRAVPGRFGKSDATGRSSGKMTAADRKRRGPPQGEPWTWLPRELLASPSWRALSINGHRLMSFLLIEHCNHAGRENGRLMATHDQLRAYGLTGDAIRKAIDECVEFGLIEHTRGGRWGGTNKPSVFRLTFYADAEESPPTNDWKRFTEAHLLEWRKRRSGKRVKIQNLKAAAE